MKAYEPFYYQLNPDSPTADSAFTGGRIQSTTFTATSLLPGVDPQQPTNIGWEYAARYANWLHNGKVNELWAFESGVYDTSTFGENGDGTLTHDVEPAAGARFWLPRRDEWVKAAHYDPDRYGAGEGGYWQFGDSSDTQPVGDLLPGEGGERNAFQDLTVLPVGSFPDVQSPWGLLDISGGEEEWLSEFDPLGFSLRTDGTGHGNSWSDDPLTEDRLEFGRSISPGFPNGFRLATVVPAPGSAG